MFVCFVVVFLILSSIKLKVISTVSESITELLLCAI